MAEARILYVATDDGLIQLANPGRSDRWREVGRALEQQPVRVVAAAPNDPLLIVAATADAVHRTMDGGFSWEAIWQGEATALAFDDDGTLYIGTKDGVLLRQHGEAWEELLRADQMIAGLSATPAHPFAEHFADLAISHVIALENLIVCCTVEHVSTIDLASGFPNVRYTAGRKNIAVIAGAASRQALVVGTQSTSPDRWTGAAVLLPGNDPVLLVGTNEELLRSVDGTMIVPEEAEGAAFADVDVDQLTLTDVDGPQHVTALVTPPRFVDHVFATTRSGELWFSNDRGRTWTSLRTNLPPANGLAFARAR